MFGVQEAKVTKDNFIHDLAAVGLGKRDRGAARGNTRHWRVIFGGVSAVVIVWPRWRENLMEAERCPATPEDEEAVYGSSLRVNKALLFTDPPAAAALFSWLFIGAGGDRRSSRAERGGVALFWGGDPGRRGVREKVVIGYGECGTRDVSELDRRDGLRRHERGWNYPEGKSKGHSFHAQNSRWRLNRSTIPPQIKASAIKQPPPNAGVGEAALFVDGR